MLQNFVDSRDGAIGNDACTLQNRVHRSNAEDTLAPAHRTNTLNVPYSKTVG